MPALDELIRQLDQTFEHKFRLRDLLALKRLRRKLCGNCLGAGCGMNYAGAALECCTCDGSGIKNHTPRRAEPTA